jgi:ribosome-associated protein
LTAKTLATKIARLALTKKAHAVTIMDLRTLTDMADFFVVCSADSDVQVKAVADAIAEGTDQLGVNPWHQEGITHRQWVLLDYVDVVVHIFHRETRRFYAIEKLWGDAKIQEIRDAPPRKARKPRAKKTA